MAKRLASGLMLASSWPTRTILEERHETDRMPWSEYCSSGPQLYEHIYPSPRGPSRVQGILRNHTLRGVFSLAGQAQSGYMLGITQYKPGTYNVWHDTYKDCRHKECG